MPTARLVVTADLVRSMQREGAILVRRRTRVSALVSQSLLTVVFAGGAMLLSVAGVHELGVPVGAAFVIFGWPIVCIRYSRRMARLLTRPYDIGGAVIAQVGPTWLRLSDPDTGYRVEYRTKRLLSRGDTALVDVAHGSRTATILVPTALLDSDDLRLIAGRR